jgi:low affinity Fe/Cu permease
MSKQPSSRRQVLQSRLRGELQESQNGRIFTRIATLISGAAGRPSSFVVALLIVIVWGPSGPVFKYSDTWQLVINPGITIVTFLMVFLIQNSHDCDAGPCRRNSMKC